MNFGLVRKVLGRLGKGWRREGRGTGRGRGGGNWGGEVWIRCLDWIKLFFLG